MARLRFQVWLDIREMQAEDLARRVGVSNQAVHRWLKHGIPRARVANVASALNIEPSELYRFVDTNIASELVDYSQDGKNPKRGLLGRKTRVDTTAANSSNAPGDNEFTTDVVVNPDTTNALLSRDPQNIFADRRKFVDRRRRQSLTAGTPSRRTTLDRRNTRYQEKHNELWWLKVDYLDGKVDNSQMPPMRYGTSHDDFEEITLDEVTHDLESQLTGTDAD